MKRTAKMNKFEALLKKHREIIVYFIFGVLTTAVNLITFYILEALFGTADSYLYNNLIAWVVGVVFAYITNKLIVFESKSWKLKLVLREASEFVGARVFSLAVEEAGLWLLIDLLKWGSFSESLFGFQITGGLIAKVILAVIVVILNYIFSKFIIFKKNK